MHCTDTEPLSCSLYRLPASHTEFPCSLNTRAACASVTGSERGADRVCKDVSHAQGGSIVLEPGHAGVHVGRLEAHEGGRAQAWDARGGSKRCAGWRQACTHAHSRGCRYGASGTCSHTLLTSRQRLVHVSAANPNMCVWTPVPAQGRAVAHAVCPLYLSSVHSWKRLARTCFNTHYAVWCLSAFPQPHSLYLSPLHHRPLAPMPAK